MKKSKRWPLFIITNVIIVGIFSAGVILSLFSEMKDIYKYPIVSMLSLMLAGTFFISLYGTYLIRKKRTTIKTTFDSYVENSVSDSGVGIIIFDSRFEIIWSSKFIEDRINRRLIGTRLESFSEEFNEHFNVGNSTFNFKEDNTVFNARINYDKKTIVLRDVTNEDLILKQYINEKVVLAELEIDNYQQLQSTLAEEDLFKVQSAVIKMLDELVSKHNITYKQYVNGKFIINTNQNVLDAFILSKFDFLDRVRKVDVADNIKVTASMGVGAGTSEFKQLSEMAKDGLVQALARGGDQVAVMEFGKRPAYYGSKTEAIKTSSRVKIKQISKLLEDRLSQDSIKKVIIYGHVFADLDAVGASLGIASLAVEYGKEVYIQNNTFDSTTSSAIDQILSKEEKELFIKKGKANKIAKKKDTIVVIVDTSELDRIENENALDVVKTENVFMFDHHRVSKLPTNILSTNIYIDTSASSASEIVTEVLSFSTKIIKPSKEVAQMLMNGIYLDTKQFTKTVSSRTFTAAAWLEKFGALPSIAADILKLPEKYSVLVSKILSNVKEVKPGFFISSYPGDVPQDIISLASDEILRVQGRKAAFVIAKMPGKNLYKMSARGIATNVQVIAAGVGGGGHFGAAAAVSAEPLEVFEDNVIQTIISTKGSDE